MRNPAKIIIGIIIFLALASIPIWATQASGNAEYVPDPLASIDYDKVAEISGSADYGCLDGRTAGEMKVDHPWLLYRLREWQVRTDSDNDPGEVYWTDANGEQQPFSLNGTCLGCHTARDVFCDTCHEWTETELSCWECHEDQGGS